MAVGAGGLGDEGLDGCDGDARGDFAGDVAAHPVGDHEEAEIRTRAVTVFVAAAAQARVRADGPGGGHLNRECRMTNAETGMPKNNTTLLFLSALDLDIRHYGGGLLRRRH